MRGLLSGRRRGLCGMLGVLLALHLGVAQAGMGSVAQGAAPCHHAAMSADMPSPGQPARGHDGGCCDLGQCHCPVFMATDPALAPRILRFVRRVAPPRALAVAPSLRLAPDLRPPIAA